MALIKLNGVAHPDLNGGVAQPVYIDARRVLLIIQGHQAYAKIGSLERNREMYDNLFKAAEDLSKKVNSYMPKMDDPMAVGWLRVAQTAAHAVNDAYAAWGRSHTSQDYHPRVDCTEVQLACGTALEHGVMLTRVWVSDPVETVAAAVEKATNP